MSTVTDIQNYAWWITCMNDQAAEYSWGQGMMENWRNDNPFTLWLSEGDVQKEIPNSYDYYL